MGMMNKVVLDKIEDNMPRKVDYARIYRMVLLKAIESKIGTEPVMRKETLYYDETGNIKHLRIKDGKLNGAKDEVFVLGGIQAEDTITQADLKHALGQETDAEVKSTKWLNGDFKAVLNKENCKKVLQLIQEKDWHVHFNIVQVLYYAFVDIVDSLEGLIADPFEYKAILYEVLKRDADKTIAHFRKYKYPSVRQENKNQFLDGIVEMIDEQIRLDAEKGLFAPLCLHLKNCVEDAKMQKDLLLIQHVKGEPMPDWVMEFRQFYQQEIFTFPQKTLIFDEEKSVEAYLSQNEIMIMDGKPLENYRFLESGSSEMIQVCDYIVAILRKYVMFLDRRQGEVEKDIDDFNETQMANYRMLNKILKNSLDYNPMFFDFTASKHLVAKFYKYIELYEN